MCCFFTLLLQISLLLLCVLFSSIQFQTSFQGTPSYNITCSVQIVVHLYNPIFLSLNKNTASCCKVGKGAKSILLAKNGVVNTPKQKCMDITVPEQDKDVSDEIFVAYSRSVDNNGQSPKVLAAPESVNQFGEFLRSLCRSDDQLLEDELISIFNPSEFDFKIFRQHLITKKPQVSLKLLKRYGNLETLDSVEKLGSFQL